MFRPQDKLLTVREFIIEQLIDQFHSFNLHYMYNQLDDDSTTLAHLGLVRTFSSTIL